MESSFDFERNHHQASVSNSRSFDIKDYEIDDLDGSGLGRLAHAALRESVTSLVFWKSVGCRAHNLVKSLSATDASYILGGLSKSRHLPPGLLSDLVPIFVPALSSLTVMQLLSICAAYPKGGVYPGALRDGFLRQVRGRLEDFQSPTLISLLCTVLAKFSVGGDVGERALLKRIGGHIVARLRGEQWAWRDLTVLAVALRELDWGVGGDMGAGGGLGGDCEFEKTGQTEIQAIDRSGSPRNNMRVSSELMGSAFSELSKSLLRSVGFSSATPLELARVVEAFNESEIVAQTAANEAIHKSIDWSPSELSSAVFSFAGILQKCDCELVKKIIGTFQTTIVKKIDFFPLKDLSKILQCFSRWGISFEINAMIIKDRLINLAPNTISDSESWNFFADAIIALNHLNPSISAELLKKIAVPLTNLEFSTLARMMNLYQRSGLLNDQILLQLGSVVLSKRIEIGKNANFRESVAACLEKSGVGGEDLIEVLRGSNDSFQK